MRGYVEESKLVQTARALRRAAELYVSARLADGPLEPSERGAALEAMAIEYAKAVAEERKRK